MTKIINWKTLLIVEWHSEPSLPSCRQRRADAQNRHSRIVLMFVEILSDSSTSLRETSWSEYVPCVCWNLPARGKRHAGGIEGRTGGIHLLLLCSHRSRITTLFGQNMANNKEDHAGNEKAGNCSVPSPSPSCPCPCPWSCPCPWPLASSEESWPRSSCWWPWGRSALLLMGSVLKTSSDFLQKDKDKIFPSQD